MVQVLDYAGGVPSADRIRAAGYGGVVRYISDDRTRGGLPGKPLKREEVAALRHARLDIAIVSQYGKDKSPDVMRGTDGGRADAKLAAERLDALGLHGWPVFFAVDFDITLAQWNTTAVHYFRAACSVLGRDRVGIYGHSRVLAWAAEDRVVADLGGGRVLGWQTAAWSRGERAPEAVLYQRPGTARVAGVAVDVNDVLAPYWGQHAPRPADVEHKTPAEPPKIVLPAAPSGGLDPKKAQYRCDADLLTWRDNGLARRPRQALTIHTDESAWDYQANRPRASAWTADQLAEYNRGGGRAANRGSYHLGVDRSGRVVRQNDDVYGTWSVGNVGNDLGFHFCLTGTAYMDRAGWMRQTRQLDRLAEVLAYYCIRYDIPARRLTPAQLKRGERGICGHWDWSQAYGGSTHWDPGGYDGSTAPRTNGGFPWDHVLGLVTANIHSMKTNGGRVAPREDDEMTPEEKARLTRVESKIDAVLTQLCGPHRHRDGFPTYQGWPQAGGRTLHDVACAAAEKLGVPGTADTKEKK